jgi:MFS family permease
MADAFKLSGLLGIVMGLFCWFLPATPPAAGKQKIAVGEAVGEIRRQPLLTLFLLAVPVSCIHQFYFVHTAPFLGQFQNEAKGFIEAVNKVFGVGGAGLMTIGQMSELGVLACMPYISKRLPRRALLAIGLLAYALRMFLFAYAPLWPEALRLPAIILGVTMHGFCFGCFIFVAFIIVDEETTSDVRASAQSLFNLVIVGIGIIVGSKIAGAVAEWATMADKKLDYTRLFTVPMWAALTCLALLLLFYPRGKKPEGRQA